jgi:hypothetical protein
VVRDFTAVRREVIQTFGQRGLQIGETTDVGIGHFRQLRHVVVERGLLNVEGFVRAPAWQHFDIKRGVFGDNGVMFQESIGSSVVPTIFTFICFMMPRAEKLSCARSALHWSQISSAVAERAVCR